MGCLFDYQTGGKSVLDPKVEINIGKQHKSLLCAQAMLDLDVKLALGDQELSNEEIEALLKGEDGLVFFKGQWIEVDRKRFTGST